MSLKLIPRAGPIARASAQELSERRATAALVILIVLLCALFAWVAAAMSAASPTVATAKTAPPPATERFEYFPSRFENQAGLPEDHIEAF
jgi:hypothetical protein